MVQDLTNVSHPVGFEAPHGASHAAETGLDFVRHAQPATLANPGEDLSQVVGRRHENAVAAEGHVAEEAAEVEARAPQSLDRAAGELRVAMSDLGLAAPERATVVIRGRQRLDLRNLCTRGPLGG